MPVPARKIWALLWGILGGVGLLGFYFLVMRLLSGNWEVAYSQFSNLKYLMGTLVLGFGLQVGLWQYLRLGNYEIGKSQVAVGGGLSGGAMVACCAHHLVDVLPILGLSAASLFLVKYQVWLLILGVLTNILGIALMVKRIKETRC